MSWRVGLLAFAIVLLALGSATGPADFAALNLVSAAILCYPLILLSLWQIARGISKQVFRDTSSEQRPAITAAVIESAIRANRYGLTVVEGFVAVWLLGILAAIAIPNYIRIREWYNGPPYPPADDVQSVRATTRPSGYEADAKRLAEALAKAKRGDADAQFTLGCYYCSGIGVAKDRREAAKWYLKAADQGYAAAQFELGDFYDSGKGVAKNMVEALKWYRKAAEQGEGMAQHRLGFCYISGHGVSKDAAEAVNWFQKAAEQNNPDSLFSLGLCYFNGEGVVKDEVVAVSWFRKAAERDYANAQYKLGCCYYNGEGVANDEVEAVKWFRKAAEQNSAVAQYSLGACYYNEQGVAKDEVEAAKWWRKAAEQNLAEAQYWLGCCYHNGQGVAKDEAVAVKWFRKAAEQNHPQAQSTLAARYENGQDVAKDEVVAAKWPRKAAEPNLAQQNEADRQLLANIRTKAEKGDAQSQFELGKTFHNGSLGMAKDEAEAVKWFRKAAEQNLAVGQYALGLCCDGGEGVAQDAAEAVKWYRKAAEQNLAGAQSMLGACYTFGNGVAKDEVEAVKWYRKAAEQNNAEAQYSLGNSYRTGKGVAKDEAEAVKWFRKAAEQNLAQAQTSMGGCYLVGIGVAKDEVEGVKWYRKAAEQNNAHAQNNLGISYDNGIGVAKDYVESYKWFLLAAGQGDGEARGNVTILENKMSREQIAEGQKLARSFKPRQVPSSGGDSSAAGIMQTRPESSGTGFFITEDGYFITNEHVAGNGAQVRLVTEAGIISARVVKLDVANDLALLKVEGKFAPLPVVSSRAVKMGSTVATVGFPNIGLQGFAPKLAKGEIAALSGVQDDPKYFQISVPVQPGNSGGGLVDERGNVVGVVSAKLSAQVALATSGALPENVNYAVKSSFLLSFLESVPVVAAKLKEPNTKNRNFEEVVRETQQATALVLVY